MQKVAIIDRGRGPELAGTRITVFDLLGFFQDGWHHASIAIWFNLSSAQVLALKDYFEEHRQEVLAEWQKIQERLSKDNPPEVLAKAEAAREKLYALREKLRRERQEKEKHEGNSAGQQHAGAYDNPPVHPGG